MIFLTDTHLKPSNIKDVWSIFRQAFKYAKQLNCDIIHAGDICDERVGWGAELQKVFHLILLEAEEEGVVIHSIAGNHDKKDLNDTFSYLSPFQYHKNFNLFEDVGLMEVGDIAYHFVPYFKEKEVYPVKLLQAKENLVEGKKNVLVTHISVESVKNNDGSEVDSTHGVALSNFELFDRVIVGHYHNKQFFKNICYIGSTFPHNFGEDNEKGVVFLEPNLNIKYLPTEFTKYVNIVREIESIDEVSELYDIQTEKGDLVKLVVKGDSSLIDSIDKTKIPVNKIETKKINKLTKSTDQIIMHNKSSIIASFKVYCQNKNLNIKEGLELCKK